MQALTQAMLYQEEYDDESSSLLKDFGFAGSFGSWAQEIMESKGSIFLVTFAFLVVLALVGACSAAASWLCFAAARVMLVLTFLSGLCMMQSPQLLKASPEVSPYTIEDAS